MLPGIRPTVQRHRGRGLGRGKILGMNSLGPGEMIATRREPNLVRPASEERLRIACPDHAMCEQVPVPDQILGGARNELETIWSRTLDVWIGERCHQFIGHLRPSARIVL